MDENRDAMEEVHQKLASKGGEDTGYNVPVKIYTKPYFKDKYGMTPPLNAEARQLVETHRLSTLLKEEPGWREQELNKLYFGVKEQLLRQMNLHLEARKHIVQNKIKNFCATNTDDELEGWRDEIVRLDRKIAYNLTLPADEIFRNADYSRISWSEISVKDLNGHRSPIACSMKWCSDLRPGINRGPWTAKEDEQLTEALQLPWTNWRFVAHELGTHRTEFACLCRAKELEAKNFNDRQAWTNEDDEKLISIVYNFHNIDSIPWEKVAKLMSCGRNATGCRRRFQYSLQTTINFGRWNHAEDMFLLEAINRFGPFDWDKIASHVPGRSAPQCRSRWSNVLDIKRNVQQFTIDEDEIILTSVGLLGRGKWSEISKLLTNRSPVDVRARFRRFLTRKMKGLPPYDDVNYRNSIWSHFSRRHDILERYQAYDSETEKLHDHEMMARRFGIGTYLISSEGRLQTSDEALNQRRQLFGSLMIFSSGIWKNRTTLEEFREKRWLRLFDTIDEETKEKLSKFQDEIAQRRRQRDLEQDKAAKGGLLEELEKKHKKEDNDRIQKLVDEVIEVTPQDEDQLRRRRLPRARIRKSYYRRRGKTVKPAQLKKLAIAKNADELRQKCELIREMHITPEIAQLLHLDYEKVIRLDGTRRRISELVLMEDLDENKYWVTNRESMILKCLLNLNRHHLMNSMHSYEKIWRLNAIKRSSDYYRNQLTFDEVPSVYAENNEESPPLDAFAILLSNVMLPNRGNLTALHQYRTKGREICTAAASTYFDPLDDEGKPIPYETFSNQRLDIQLPHRVTSSVEYLLLRSRMYKMFFLPMLLQYGQMSSEAKVKVKQEIVKQQLRRRNERIFQETGDLEMGILDYDNGADIVIGRKNTVAENEIPNVYKRMAIQSSHINDSIDSLLSSINSEPEEPAKKKRRSRKKQKPQPPSISMSQLFVPAEKEQRSSVQPSTSNETPIDRVEALIESVVNPSLASPLSPPQSKSAIANIKPKDIQVVALRPEIAVNESMVNKLGAYQPRWVKAKKKKEPQSSEADTERELTLADLLFVRGRKRRVQAGLYDRQHSEMVLNSIRPQLESDAPEDNEDETASEPGALRRIKQELIDK